MLQLRLRLLVQKGERKKHNQCHHHMPAWCRKTRGEEESCGNATQKKDGVVMNVSQINATAEESVRKPCSRALVNA